MRLGTGLSLTLPRASGGQTDEQWLAANVAVWLDPSDLDSMRQDRVGAPPGTVGGSNYVLSSEDVSTASWQNVSSMTRTADTLTELSGTPSDPMGWSVLNNAIFALSIEYISMAGEFKANGRTRVGIGGYISGSVYRFAIVDLDTLSYAGSDIELGGGNTAITSVSVSDAGDGWVKAEILFRNITAVGAVRPTICLVDGTSFSYSGDGASGVMVRKVQANPGTTLDGYTKTTTSPIIKAAVNSPVGSMRNKGTAGGWFITSADAKRPILRQSGSLYYLDFDGTDDCMYSSAAIDLSASDAVTVCAGINHANTAGVWLEHGTNVNSVNGTFAMFAVNGLNEWEFSVRGSLTRGAAVTDATMPEKVVITGHSDISLDSVVIRRNGVIKNTTSLDLGSGNFSNSVIYVGMRGNVSTPSNCDIYSISAFQSVLSASDLSRIETYAAGKSGVTL
jgi:hypothetical protein